MYSNGDEKPLQKYKEVSACKGASHSFMWSVHALSPSTCHRSWPGRRSLTSGGGVRRAQRVGGVLQVPAQTTCEGFAGRRGVDKVSQGANLTKKPPNLTAAPGIPALLARCPAGLASLPDSCVFAARARPLLPVPSWGFVHAGRWAESKRRVRDTVIAARVNLIPWVDCCCCFFFFEKLTSGRVTNAVCFSRPQFSFFKFLASTMQLFSHSSQVSVQILTVFVLYFVLPVPLYQGFNCT